MKRWSPFTPRLCLGLMLIGTAGAASAQTVAPPNIHFLIDTSGSMRELPQVTGGNHVEFFDTTTGGCFNPRLDADQVSRGWNSQTAYPVPDLGTGLGSDTGFPNLFQDSKFYGYMYWGESTDPTPQWTSKEQACEAQVPNWSSTGAADYTQCLSCLHIKGYYKVPGAQGTNSGNMANPNFIFWGRYLNFNPPKYVTVKAAIKKAIKDLSGMRAGFSYFANSTLGTQMGQSQNPSCLQIRADSSAFDNNRASYINSINGLSFTTGTPLGRSLLNVGFYFTSGDDVYRDNFGFGTAYSYPSGFRNTLLTSQGRSWCWGCQHSAIILISDGEPTSDSLPATIVSQLRILNGGPVYCSDSKPCGPYNMRDKGNSPSSYIDDNPNYYLDDVAKLLANQDLQQATPAVIGDFDTSGSQSLRIHTIGYGIQSNLLENTAQVGGGLSFTASDASSLEAALTEILNDVQTQAATCTLTP
ncbi:hypothetical protein [Hyalangium rubrum]|uniref:Type IV fimbrial biogenesis protein PilY1 n=1 Tax=Hyalangium rubrum TaxID=3103134 RepID=A0ABU5H8W6_9BACT|nr:hypothetical protein [Hyalangium sp. s54d21]MDY7229681.1 hypothetical protein [Hyalangium sp. s54d21]